MKMTDFIYIFTLKLAITHPSSFTPHLFSNPLWALILTNEFPCNTWSPLKVPHKGGAEFLILDVHKAEPLQN